MGSIKRMVLAWAMMLFAFAPAAMADTLTPRATPFTPSQAVADQYTIPPGANPSSPGGGVRGTTDRGDTAGDTAGELPVAGDTAGQAPVTAGATAPAKAQGTLPFTGSDLLALVWLALALVAIGSLVELARRRVEARRARTPAG